MGQGSSNKDFSVIAPNLLMLVAIGWGLFIAPNHFHSRRPAVERKEHSQNKLAKQNPDSVEARLWEDPFTARDRWEETEKVEFDCANILTDVETDHKDKRLLLCVLLNGAPYSEVKEKRLRTRTAVISSLATSGYGPSHAGNLKFAKLGSQDPSGPWLADVVIERFEALNTLLIPAPDKKKDAQSDTKQGGDKEITTKKEYREEADTKQEGEEKIIYNYHSIKNHYRWVTIVYVDEYQVGLGNLYNLLLKLRCGADRSTSDSGVTTDFKVLGPSGSDALLALMRSTLEHRDPDKEKAKKDTPEKCDPEEKVQEKSLTFDMLKDMALIALGRKERPPSPEEFSVPSPPIPILSTNATVSDAKLQKLLHKEFKCRGMTDTMKPLLGQGYTEDLGKGSAIELGLVIHRLTSNDASTCRALIEELRLRNVHYVASAPERVRPPPEPGEDKKKTKEFKCLTTTQLSERNDRMETGDMVALISEWDTLYGRSLPMTFVEESRKMEHERAGKAHLRQPNSYPPFTPGHEGSIRHYSYLRGLDGALPGSKNLQDKSPKEHQASASTNFSAYTDPVHGVGQMDYLRRLISKMKADEKTAGGNFRAIGILGSDVYDKLIILQALKKKFPTCVFFTTDLDAELFSATEIAHTRNLVVASPLGLQLRPEYQGDIMPFRDVYQTGSYFAGLTALNYFSTRQHTTHLWPGPRKNWLPRVFEISRSGAVQLSPKESKRDWSGDECDHSTRYSLDPNPYWGDWTDGSFKEILTITLQLFFVLVLAATFSPALRKSWKSKNSRWRPYAIFYVSVYVLLCAFIIFAHNSPNEEPFTFWHGISVWPTTLLRLFTAGLCIFYLLRCIHIVRRETSEWAPEPALQAQDTEGQMAEKRLLKFEEEKKRIRAAWNHEGMLLNDPKVGSIRKSWIHLCRWVRCKLLSASGHGTNPTEYKEPEVSGWYRPIAAISRFFLILICNPFRWTSRNISKQSAKKDPSEQEAKMLANGFPLFIWMTRALLFYSAGVVIWVCIDGIPYYPVRGIYSPIVHVAAVIISFAALQVLLIYVTRVTQLTYHYLQQLAKEIQKLEEAEDKEKLFRKAADIANVVSRFVFYPFAAIFITLAGRSSLFDGYNWPLSLIGLYVFTCIFLTGTAIAMQRVAKRIKLSALNSLQDTVTENQKKKGGPDKIRAIMDEIRSVDDGVFAPLKHNQIIRAALIPIGGISIIHIMEVLSAI